MNRFCCVTCKVVVLASVSGGALAQSAAAPAGLEEVVVTAQKRSENLQQVPLSVSVLDASALAERGVLKAADLAGTMPGIKAQGVNTPAVFVRGIGTSNASITGDQGVAIHLDGVFQPLPTAFAAGLLDVERIEVLKGPQGTLYGRSALGGNINVISAAPVQEFQAKVLVEAGDYSLLRGQGVLNVPVTDSLALRMAVQKEQHDGYASNGTDDLDREAARLRLQYEPTANVKLGLNGFYTRSQGHGAANHYFHDYPGIDRPSDPWDTAISADVHALDLKNYQVSGTVEVDFGFATLTYIPSYISDEYNAISPYLLNSPTPFRQIFDVHSKTRTHEVRLTSPQGERLDWTIGLYHLDEERDYSFRLPPIVNNSGMIETKSASLFGQASYGLTENLRAIVGARFTEESKRQHANNQYYFHHSWSPFSGKVGLQYELAEQSMLYATVANGFKAGGFYTAPGDNSFGPETALTYEVGSKNRFADGSVQLNAAVYLYKYDDYQVNATTAGFNGTFVQGVFNAGKVDMYGTDLESIFQLTPHDRLEIAATYLHGEFKSFSVPVTSGRVGDPIPYSPTFSAHLGYQHSFDLPGGSSLVARADSHYETESWLSLNHRPSTRQGDFTRTDFTLIYKPHFADLQISAWVRNIENEAVKTSVTDSLGLETYILAAPRTVGLTLAMDF